MAGGPAGVNEQGMMQGFQVPTATSVLTTTTIFFST